MLFQVTANSKAAKERSGNKGGVKHVFIIQFKIGQNFNNFLGFSNLSLLLKLSAEINISYIKKGIAYSKNT